MVPLKFQRKNNSKVEKIAKSSKGEKIKDSKSGRIVVGARSGRTDKKKNLNKSALGDQESVRKVM